MTNYTKFVENYGKYDQRPDDRPRNYLDWNAEQEKIWRNKPLEEVESYYINLKNFCQRMKKEPKGGVKNISLLHKKKQWRDGLFRIMCQDTTLGKRYRKTMLPKTLSNLSQAVSTVSQLQAELEKERKRKQDLHCNEVLDDSDTEEDTLLKKD